MSINRVNISGNLTHDSELRQTQGGNAVLSFGVAVTDRRRNPQTGEWEDFPNYVNCTLFGNRAQAIAQYLTKGVKVAVEGKLRWSQWQDRETGKNRSKLEVIVDEIEFMSSRNQNAPQSAPQPQYGQQNQQVYANPPQQQMAPQMAPQAPQMPHGGYQQQIPQNQPPMPDMYQEDIPFGG